MSNPILGPLVGILFFLLLFFFLREGMRGNLEPPLCSGSSPETVTCIEGWE